MKYKNLSIVPRLVFGRGSFGDLDEIIKPNRKEKFPFIFFVDNVFSNVENDIIDNIPLLYNDKIIFIDVDENEPKTDFIDSLTKSIKDEFGQVSGIIGLGGGSVLDITKAVSLMINNEGSSVDYQGWDLIKNKGVYNVGIPTLSGTGAEVSRTAVLTGPQKKLGINSDYTIFDQIILDPNLIRNVPKQQRFFTGMDCYIHCVESLEGHFINAFSQTHANIALNICEDIFLKESWDELSDEKLMMASYHGGMSISYSQVGVAHAMSYGLSFLMGIRHGIGNCIVFNNIAEFYPKATKKFKEMLYKNDISLPSNICDHLSEKQWDKMIKLVLSLEPIWHNALGKNWKNIIDREKLMQIYMRF